MKTNILMRNKSPKVRFHHTPLHRLKEPHALTFLIERSSFWIASLSLVAFLVGNMVGQYGWHVFWKSVWGEGSDVFIAYTGTVSPIEKIPDYSTWATKYGGDPSKHSYRQVPQDALVDIPSYSSSKQRRENGFYDIGQVYSVGYMGSYSTGGERDGSHPAVDIRVPVGTPVRSMANGVVMEVKSSGGFGKVVVIKHPNVPDPSNPRNTTTLYSSYAHLSSAYVKKGTVVQKGEQIALSGKTGFASGPHLHFQIDREEAPWHPYWPFTDSEAYKAGLSVTQAINSGFHRERGYAYTVHPMLYVQANYQSNTSSPTLVASSDAEEKITTRRVAPTTVIRRAPSLRQRIASAQARALERARVRIARQRFSGASRGVITSINVQPIPVQPKPQSQPEPEPKDEAPIVVKKEEVVSASAEQPATFTSGVSGTINSVSVQHDGSFSGRGWETIRITLLDAEGRAITSPDGFKDIYLRTAYGKAEFRPTVLRERNFIRGEAAVRMLPRGRRTVVIKVQPYGDISTPMQYRK